MLLPGSVGPRRVSCSCGRAWRAVALTHSNRGAAAVTAVTAPPHGALSERYGLERDLGPGGMARV
jgi:hypothetical protein